MRNTIASAVKLLAVIVVVAGSQLTVQAAEPTIQWEYKVLTKGQVLDLGKKDLAAGLNKLGDDGWELVAVDNAYIFKRPKVQHNAEVLKIRVKIAEADVEQQRERVQWSQRMVKKGFVPANQLKDEVRLLRELEIALEEAEQDLKSLPTDPKKAAENKDKPQK